MIQAAKVTAQLFVLAAVCLPVFANIPRTPLVAEKPHQGVASFALVSQRAESAANPMNAPGIAGCLYDSGTRPCCSGKERDAETGLDYFGARYMSAAQGRFTSPDPGPFIFPDPQSWNRYAYVQNNPLKYIDPTGTTLELTGAYGQDLTDELEKQTGLHLSRDAKSGQVTIDKGTKRDKNVGSKDLAKLVEKIIKDKKTDVSIDVGQNQAGTFVDAFTSRQIDFADYSAVNASHPEFAATLLGHVFMEYYTAEKANPGVRGMTGFPAAHMAGMEFESKVLSNFTGKSEQTRVDAGAIPVFRFIYSTVTYDVTLRGGAGGSVDVGGVTKIKNKKPGVP